MIEVTRTDGRKIIINAELIQYIEETPDVVITLTNGAKVLVNEKVKIIVDMVIDYRRKLNQNSLFCNKDNV
jgi:flagellar protein FlbD